MNPVTVRAVQPLTTLAVSDAWPHKHASVDSLQLMTCELHLLPDRIEFHLYALLSCQLRYK